MLAHTKMFWAKHKIQVKMGACRIVFLTDRYAIKIPRVTHWTSLLNGLQANIMEQRFSTLKSEYLCPILFYVPGGFLSVMPRLREITDEEFEMTGRYWALDNEMISKAVELKKSSFGFHHKLGIVAVDYH